MNATTTVLNTNQYTPKPPPVLLHLPAELGNAIWEYALVEPERKLIIKNGILPEPALLSSCSAIRAEALKVYYGNHSFHVSSQKFCTTNIRL